MNVRFDRSRRMAWVALLLAVPILLVGVDRVITDGAIAEAVVDAVRAPSELDDLSRDPETNDDGGLTKQGKSEQRADWFWGLGLLAVGGAMAIWSLTDVGRSRKVLTADDTGLFLAVSSSGNDVFVPWDQVESIRSTISESDVGPIRSIEITVSGNTWIPSEPPGATWDGNRLLVDADDWRIPAHEAAGVLETMLERSRYPGPEPDVVIGEPES